MNTITKAQELLELIDMGGKVYQYQVDALLKEAHLHIASGNTKLGKIYNFSVTPMVTCSRAACETCGAQGCYACENWHRFPDTRNAWDENTENILFELEQTKVLLHLWFTVYNPDYFRIHVGGDFATRDYAQMWYDLAEMHGNTAFFTFTKQYDHIRGIPFYLLPNFSLHLSEWPGYPVPADLTAFYHVAYVNTGYRDSSCFPAEMYHCPGSCRDCMVCANDPDVDVIFDFHGSAKVVRPAQRKLIKESSIAMRSMYINAHYEKKPHHVACA